MAVRRPRRNPFALDDDEEADEGSESHQPGNPFEVENNTRHDRSRLAPPRPENPFSSSEHSQHSQKQGGSTADSTHRKNPFAFQQSDRDEKKEEEEDAKEEEEQEKESGGGFDGKERKGEDRAGQERSMPEAVQLSHASEAAQTANSAFVHKANIGDSGSDSKRDQHPVDLTVLTHPLPPTSGTSSARDRNASSSTAGEETDSTKMRSYPDLFASDPESEADEDDLAESKDIDTAGSDTLQPLRPANIRTRAAHGASDSNTTKVCGLCVVCMCACVCVCVSVWFVLPLSLSVSACLPACIICVCLCVCM